MTDYNHLRSRGLGNCLSVDVGRFLRRARLTAGYASPYLLAAAVRSKTGLIVSQRSIYRYERGDSIPTVETLHILSQILGQAFFHEFWDSIFQNHSTRKASTGQQATPAELRSIDCPCEHQMALFNAECY